MTDGVAKERIKHTVSGKRIPILFFGGLVFLLFVLVSGTAKADPAAVVSPASVDATFQEGDNYTFNLTVSNTGTDTLFFNVTDNLTRFEFGYPDSRLPPDPRGFNARHDIYTNYWNDGGNDAFDGYAYVDVTVGGVTRSFLEITPGVHEYTTNGYTYRLVSEWLENHVLRLTIEPVSPGYRDDITVRVYGNLGSDGNTQSFQETAYFQGIPIRYLVTNDGPLDSTNGDPQICHFMIPYYKQHLDNVSYSLPSVDDVDIRATGVSLPVTAYISASYHTHTEVADWAMNTLWFEGVHLSYSRENGSVLPGMSVNVTTTIHGDYADPGFYPGAIYMTSNDTTNSTIVVPTNATILPLAHDIKVVNVSCRPYVVNRPFTVWGNVTNQGTRSESNVEVQLFVDGTMVNSTTISLNPGQTATVSMGATVTEGGEHAFTVYAVPVSGETVTINNKRSYVGTARLGIFSPPYEQWAEDEDGDGLYDWLHINVTVDAGVGFNCRLRASLRDASNNTIINHYTYRYLNPGLNTFYVTFDGRDINNSGRDPHHVDLTLEYTDDWSVQDTDTYFLSPAYNWSDFNGPGIAFNPPHSHYTVDGPDADAEYDYLVVNASVNVTRAGWYKVTGELRTTMWGTIITTLENATFLTPGNHTVQLWYDGHVIRNSGRNGYSVRFVIYEDPYGDNKYWGYTWYTAWFNATTQYTWDMFQSDVDPPVFGGIETLRDTGKGGELYASWSPGWDEWSEPLTYNVYIAASSGGQNFSSPNYTTADTSLYITGLTDNQRYYVVVRAVDSVGNEGGNTVELSSVPTTLVPEWIDGDWIISTPETRDGAYIHVNGSVVITPTGSLYMNHTSLHARNMYVQEGGWFLAENSPWTVWLDGNLMIDGNYTLDSTRLVVNCTSDGQYEIRVNSTGYLNVLNNSIIQPGNTNYYYNLEVYGHLTVDHSDVWDAYSVEIRGTSAFADISYSRINTTNYQAYDLVYVENAVVNITHSVLHHARASGVHIRGGAARVVIENTFIFECNNNWMWVNGGVYAESGVVWVWNSTFRNNHYNDVGIRRATVEIYNSTLESPTSYGLTLDSFQARVWVNGTRIFNKTSYGILMYYANLARFREITVISSNVLYNWKGVAVFEGLKATATNTPPVYNRGETFFFNSTLNGSSNNWVDNGGEVYLYNSTTNAGWDFNDDTGRVYVGWFLNIKTVDAMGLPVPRSDVDVYDVESLLKSGKTRADGWLNWTKVISEEVSVSGVTLLTPHEIIATNSSVGAGSNTTTIESNKVVVVVLTPAVELRASPENIFFSDNRPIDGEVITITANITNNGSIGANNVRIDIMMNGEVVYTTYANIPAGGYAVVSTDVTLPFGLINITVWADPTDAIPEVSETNNAATRWLPVTWYIDSPETYIGEVFHVANITVTGTGNLTLVDCIINVSASEDYDPFVIRTSGGITFINTTITSSDPDVGYSTDIYSWTYMDNVSIMNMGSHNIYVYSPSHPVTILNSNINFPDYGFYIRHSNKVSIINTTITSHDSYPIYLYHLTNSRIENSTISSQYGYSIMDSCEIVIKNTTIFSRYSWSGLGIYGNSVIEGYNSTFSVPHGWGLYVDITAGELSGNNCVITSDSGVYLNRGNVWLNHSSISTNGGSRAIYIVNSQAYMYLNDAQIFETAGEGVYISDGVLEAYNSTITGRTNDIHLTGSGEVYLYNSSLSHDTVQYDSGSCYLHIGWLLDVVVVNTTFSPLPGVHIWVNDTFSSTIGEGFTGPDGWLRWIPVINETRYQSGWFSHNPYRIEAANATDKANATGDITDNAAVVVILGDHGPPLTSVDTLEKHFNANTTVNVTAWDETLVRDVSLYYRYSPDNSSWGPWTLFGVDVEEPWSFDFTWPDDEGYYQFYSNGTDLLGKTEPAHSTADTWAIYDTTPPATATALYNLFTDTSPFTISVTASDTYTPSSYLSVELWYYYSTDNTVWSGPYSGGSPDGQWWWNFTFPMGEGFYRFYTIGTDLAGNMESPPGTNDTWIGYDTTPPNAVMNPYPYWVNSLTPVPITLSASASDNTSGIWAVYLYYTYSTDNTSWGPWTLSGTAFSTPYTWTFSFPDGEGYYQFAAVGEDNLGHIGEIQSSLALGYDITAPYTTSTYPVNETTGVFVGSPIFVNVSEPLNPTTALAAFTITGPGGINITSSGYLSYSGTTYTWIPSSPLLPFSTYWVNISSAATDIAGNPFIFNSTWFTTGAADLQPPTIVSVSPADGTTTSRPNTAIVITFNETMNRTSVESAINITGPGSFLPLTFSWNLNTLTITHPLFEYNSWYTVTINASLAKDISDNTLDGNGNGTAEGSPTDDYVWTFRTRSDSPPTSQCTGVSSPTLTDTLVISYTASDDWSLTSIELWYRFNGGSWTLYATDAASGTSHSGSFLFTFPEGDGLYEFYTRAKDDHLPTPYYETAPSGNDTWTLRDANDPLINITGRPASITDQTTATVSWTAWDANGISYTEIRIDGGEWTQASDTYTFNSLSEGRHTITIRAVDVVGRETEVSFSFLVDLGPPNVSITSPSPGGYYNTMPTVTWTAEDPNGIDTTMIRVDGERWTMAFGTSYTLTGLRDGEHTVEIWAIDGAGRETTASVTFTYDRTSPRVSSTSPADGDTGVQTENITIVFSEPMRTDSTAGILVTTDHTTPLNGSFTWTDPSTLVWNGSLPQGATIYVVFNGTATDLAGNSLRSTEIQFTTYRPPTISDTDGDGMPDTWETDHGLDLRDPADANSDGDGDGLANLQEYENGTNPENADTDGDGMPDGWEISVSINPLDSSDGAADADGDGYTNKEEYEAGTDPNDPASHPAGDTTLSPWLWLIIVIIIAGIAIALLLSRKKGGEAVEAMPPHMPPPGAQEPLLPAPPEEPAADGTETGEPEAETTGGERGEEANSQEEEGEESF
ncbi:MAG: Ig-like domain-containing protein [Thermoplasmata archaeon]|nr:Ig-like domain-containing protein [Thermoplasmata archaeon]